MQYLDSLEDEENKSIPRGSYRELIISAGAAYADNMIDLARSPLAMTRMLAVPFFARKHEKSIAKNRKEINSERGKIGKAIGDSAYMTTLTAASILAFGYLYR